MDWTDLERFTRRPRPFSNPDGLFWSDPYVSSHVVMAHLDDRTDDASRPLVVVEREAQWIASLRPRPGRLLDLGCGVGRHAWFWASWGWSVTGIDVAEPSLEYARQEARDAGLSIDYRRGDFSVLRLPPNQDLIVIAYGTLGTLSPRRVKSLITRCRRALAPGGLLVFDVFRRSWCERQINDFRSKPSWQILPHEGFWSDRAHLVLSRMDAYSVLRTWGQTFIIVDDRVRRFTLWYRWFDREHVQDEIVPGASVEWYGGLDGRKLVPSSSWIAAVAHWEEDWR